MKFITEHDVDFEDANTNCADAKVAHDWQYDSDGRLYDRIAEYAESRKRVKGLHNAGRITWKVERYVVDQCLEGVLQTWYDNGYTVRYIWRNPPNDSGLETTTIAFSKKDRT